MSNLPPPVPAPSEAGEGSQDTTQLIRAVGLRQATALNMIDMIGVGPFITIPLIIAAMGGPQAMLGWVLGAVLAVSDGLVWAELGAAMPNAGGPYQYLKTIYGPNSLGRLVSFLFIWQLTFSAPLSIASGCIGLAGYSTYFWSGLGRTLAAKSGHLQVPYLGALDVSVVVTLTTFIAILTCLFAVFLLYRRITVIGRLSSFLWVGVILTIAWVIISGLTHFDPSRAFSFPPGAFHLNQDFFLGLGGALLVSIYDYWGYYNVCFLGGEIKDPGRTIPRAIVYSTLLVGAIYIVMNVSILGVVRWQDLAATAGSNERLYVISSFMETIYGKWAGNLATVLVMWTAFASVFSLILGYSRVPYAAALDGNYFKVFARVHPKHRIPYVSLLVMGAVACLFCFLKLADVIAALVVIRILIQFIAQIVGVVILRIRRPDMPRPFRMWLYPLPAVIAFTGFVYVLIERRNFQKELRYALVLLAVGVIVYVVRAGRRGEWPFGNPSVGRPAL
jgi:APA family basic amino acid/polyamine antiporter